MKWFCTPMAASLVITNSEMRLLITPLPSRMALLVGEGDGVVLEVLDRVPGSGPS